MTSTVICKSFLPVVNQCLVSMLSFHTVSRRFLYLTIVSFHRFRDASWQSLNIRVTLTFTWPRLFRLVSPCFRLAVPLAYCLISYTNMNSCPTWNLGCTQSRSWTWHMVGGGGSKQGQSRTRVRFVMITCAIVCDALQTHCTILQHSN